MGKGLFKIHLGPVKLQKEIIVAQIEDDGLLGMDILQNDESGPADIIMSEGIIRLKGHKVPCINMSTTEGSRKVTLADNYTIPGHSEALVDVFIDRTEEDDILSLNEFIV